MSGLLGQYKMQPVKLLLCSTWEFGKGTGWTQFISGGFSETRQCWDLSRQPEHISGQNLPGTFSLYSLPPRTIDVLQCLNRQNRRVETVTVSPESNVFPCRYVENNVMRKRLPRWCVSLRKAPSSVKSAGVHSVLSLAGLVSGLRGGRRKRGSEDPAALFPHLLASWDPARNG